MIPPSRPLGRRRPGGALLAGASGLATLLLVGLASPGDDRPRVEAAAAPGPHRVGMTSCAARGCHGSVDATEPGQGRVFIKDGASTTWLNYDPHARAYAALLEPRSVKMAGRLATLLGGQPAHRAGLCLSCHSTVGPGEAIAPEVAPLSDGVSCEACHGPAEAWRDKHLSPTWRALPSESKALDGLVDLSTPASRARSCVGCHVGDRSRGMDMNHDLIAAGHPRLNFEFATYQAGYPKHWKEDCDEPGRAGERADFEAKSWAVGQVVAAGAALDLLKGRALASKEGAARVAPAPEAAWPEFSSYDCFACHHDLVDPSPRQGPGPSPGRLRWETWPSAMLPGLAGGTPGVDLGPLDELRVEMAEPWPDPDRVAGLATVGKGRLDALLKATEARTFDGRAIASLASSLGSSRPAGFEGWDRAAQRLLALQAMARAAKGPGVAIGPEAEAILRDGSRSLEFPPGYDSPKGAPAAGSAGPVR